MVEKDKQTSSIPQGIAGLLAYFIPFFGGIFFLAIEKENRLIRFHAVQSILLWIVFVILSAVLWWIPVISTLLYIIVLALWVFMMYQALMERMFSLPIIGDVARHQAFGAEDTPGEKTEEKKEAGKDKPAKKPAKKKETE